MGILLALALSATIDVPAGSPIGPALAAARPGDVVRLGPGVHQASLGRVSGIRVEGAGAGATELRVPEGEDGLVAAGRVELAGMTIRAGPAHSAVKVLGGSVRLERVVLSGGASGAFVDEGRLEGDDVDLHGGQYGLLSRRGEVALRGGSARGGVDAVAVLGGALELSRFALTGPSREGGLSASGGRVRLSAVAVRTPGPTGISVVHAELEGDDVLVSGAREQGGFLGDCVSSRGGTLRLASSELRGCAGTALSASGGSVHLSGVQAEGGRAGCLVFVDGARAELDGNVCSGGGPALVAGSGARVRARMNRWLAVPTLWVDCAEGARFQPGEGERESDPCPAPR